jgi:hypothetical protein
MSTDFLLALASPLMLVMFVLVRITPHVEFQEVFEQVEVNLRVDKRQVYNDQGDCLSFSP